MNEIKYHLEISYYSLRNVTIVIIELKRGTTSFQFPVYKFRRNAKTFRINIALKLGTQLSISIAIFQVFSMTRQCFELTTSHSGGEHSYTITLPVGRPRKLFQGHL